MKIETLKEYADRILNTSSLELKLEYGLSMSRVQGSTVPDPGYKYLGIPERPARPSNYHYDSEKESNLDQESDTAVRLKHFLESAFIDVEIGAMEASCALILLAEGLPFEFYQDFASHISDEARHAQIIRSKLDQLGGLSSEVTYSNRVWNKVSKARNLIERIMIENVIEEGWAADRTVDLVKSLRAKKFDDVADMFQEINQDEMRHAKIGNKWALRLLGDEEKYLDMYERLCEEIHPGASHIHYPPVRMSSGFGRGFFNRFYRK